MDCSETFFVQTTLLLIYSSPVRPRIFRLFSSQNPLNKFLALGIILFDKAAALISAQEKAVVLWQEICLCTRQQHHQLTDKK